MFLTRALVAVVFLVAAMPLRAANAVVNATLDGAPWSGTLSFYFWPASGAPPIYRTTVPVALDLEPGSYTVVQEAGGPLSPQYSRMPIQPAVTQTVTADAVTTWTLPFVTHVCPVPPTPVMTGALTYVPGTDSYTISWETPPGTALAASYELEEANRTLGTVRNFMVWLEPRTSQTFSHDVADTTEYHYRVRAVEACAMSPWSEVWTVFVSPPCHVTAVPAALSESWRPHTADVAVTASCSWYTSILDPAVWWVWPLSGPSGSGDGVVTLHFVDNTAPHPRRTTLHAGDADIPTVQRGMLRGPDFNLDGAADLGWQNGPDSLQYDYLAGAERIGTRAEALWQTNFHAYGAGFFRKGQPANAAIRGATGLVNIGVTVDFPPLWQLLGILDYGFDGAAAVFGREPSGLVSAAGVASSGPAAIWREPDPAWQIVAAGDFDADGYSDLVWRNETSGTVFMMFLGARFSATRTAVAHYEPDPAWKIVASGDTNGDGRFDLLWRNTTTGAVWVQLMDGANSTGSGVVWHEPDPAWEIAGMADFNGDDRWDILWRNSTTGLLFTVFLDGGSVIGTGMPPGRTGPEWRLFAPAVVRRYE